MSALASPFAPRVSEPIQHLFKYPCGSATGNAQNLALGNYFDPSGFDHTSLIETRDLVPARFRRHLKPPRREGISEASTADGYHEIIARVNFSLRVEDDSRVLAHRGTIGLADFSPENCAETDLGGWVHKISGGRFARGFQLVADL